MSLGSFAHRRIERLSTNDAGRSRQRRWITYGALVSRVRVGVNGAPQRLRLRWRGLDRAHKVGLGGIAILTVAAVGVRLWLVLGYGQAFIGFPDSSVYADSARHYSSIFGNRQPAGYPLFLRIMRSFSDQLSAPILVQHVAGIATGVLLYKAVLRTGAPPYLGLAPAAVVFFGGTGLLVEHALLSDSLFAFFQALGLYAAVRALGESRLRWSLLSGLAFGLSFWLRTVGIGGLALVPALLIIAAPGNLRRRLLSAAAAAFALILLVACYIVAQGFTTGYWGYEQQGAWNLYGRVATFVDCSHFTAPTGTAFLCPAEPLAHRRHQAAFQYSLHSPAVRRFGSPATAPPYANSLLQRFSVAVIEQQPDAYANAILHSLTFFISDRRGEGYTAKQLREKLFNRKGNTDPPDILAAYSHVHAGGMSGSVRPLVFYESHTRVQGVFLVVLLVLALLSVALLRGRTRWASLLFTSTAILMAILAVAGNRYDARYAYPDFGPLAAAAALGAWAIATRLKQLLRRSPRPRTRRADARRASTT
jgi:hypothetical protein